MKLLSEKSEIVYPSVLDFFGSVASATGIKSQRQRELSTESVASSEGPWSFRVYNELNSFIDLSRTYIKLTCSIVDQNGAGFNFAANPDAAGAIVYNEMASVIQYLPKTLFSQVQVSINGVIVNDTGPNHAYMAFILNELLNDLDNKRFTLGQLAAYDYTDSGENNNENPAHLNKAGSLTGGNVVTYIASLDIPLARTGKLLLSNCDLKLTFQRNPDKFVINSYAGARQWKLKIDSIKLLVHEMELEGSCVASIEKKLEDGALAIYPQIVHELRSIHIPQGAISSGDLVLFSQSQQLPRKIFFGLVTPESFAPNDYTKDPFIFANHGLKNFTVEWGSQIYPLKPWNLDYANKNYQHAFLGVKEALGFAGGNRTNGISYEDFEKSKCIYCVDLSSGAAHNTAAYELANGGVVRIRIEFSAAVPLGGLYLIALGEFQSFMTLDKLRNPIVLPK